MLTLENISFDVKDEKRDFDKMDETDRKTK